MRRHALVVAVFLGASLMAYRSVGAAAIKDRCVTASSNGGSPNVFIFQDVAPLVLNQAIALKGIYFFSTRKPTPLHGSAVLNSDGKVRIGIVVHSSAYIQNDFTITGAVSTSFAGTVGYDNDGDFLPNNGTLVFEAAECSGIAIP
jgi:hypothetical protein